MSDSVNPSRFPPLEWQPLLQCGLIRIRVTPTAVTFQLPHGSCTDMTGAIKLATIINPDVTCIYTVCRDKKPGSMSRDTTYRLVDGKWAAGR